MLSRLLFVSTVLKASICTVFIQSKIRTLNCICASGKLSKKSTNYVSDFCSDIPVVLLNTTRVIHETGYFAPVCCDICEYICISSFECKLQNLRI